MEVFVSMVTLHPLVFQPPYSSVRIGVQFTDLIQKGVFTYVQLIAAVFTQDQFNRACMHEIHT